MVLGATSGLYPSGTPRVEVLCLRDMLSDLRTHSSTGQARGPRLPSRQRAAPAREPSLLSSPHSCPLFTPVSPLGLGGVYRGN